MSIPPRSVADVLRQHVTLEVEGIDRMYLNVYVPALQRAGGGATFFRFHPGHRFASSVWMDPISKAFISRVDQFATQAIVPFEKGQRKDDVAAAYRRKCPAEQGVLFIGKAQEKDAGLPHRKATQRAIRGHRPLAGPFHRHGQSLR